MGKRKGLSCLVPTPCDKGGILVGASTRLTSGVTLNDHQRERKQAKHMRPHSLKEEVVLEIKKVVYRLLSPKPAHDPVESDLSSPANRLGRTSQRTIVPAQVRVSRNWMEGTNTK